MDAVELNFKEFGAGKPLLILHGLFGTLDNWTTIGKHLGENGFHVYLLDQRNHGKSPHSPNWDYLHMAFDLKLFIESKQLISPILLGHSMGGKTVMKFATLYPELASKLVVADIAPKYYPPHHQLILKGLHSIDLDQLTSRGEADKTMSSIIENAGIRQFLLKNLQRTPLGFNWKMNLEVIEQNIENVGEPLEIDENSDIPTLFIRGGDSDYILDEDLDILSNHFPNYTLKTIDGVGHWLHAEKPTEFIQLLSNFINA